MTPVKIKIPIGLVTEMAQKRSSVNKYETHRGFKALAFYLLTRSLTTSNGIYREHNQGYNVKGSKDGLECWSRFRKRIATSTGFSFNTISNLAKHAQEFGFITITDKGYQFTAIETIGTEYFLAYPGKELEFKTITIDPTHESLEHILKTLVFGENFSRQQFVVLQKIKRIPGVAQKLSAYIPNWQSLSAKELLNQVCLWQKKTFETYTKGTEAYDLFHSIHADISITCKRITKNFAFKCRRSASYLKSSLVSLKYITVTSREVIGNCTRKPHEPDGSLKPITFMYLPQQKQRKWI